MRMLRLVVICFGTMLTILSAYMSRARPDIATTELLLYQTYTDNHFELYIMRPDGSQPQTLADYFDIELPITSYYVGRWSPDGKWIAVGTGLASTTHIYRIRLADGHIQQLTNGFVTNTVPAWSPNGLSILYTSSSADVFRMRADGGQPRRLTDPATIEFAASWSPNGRWIAFMSDSGAGISINRMRPDGSHRFQLTHYPYSEEVSEIAGPPVWSPDSEWLVFSKNGDLFKIQVDGSQLQQLTFNEAIIDVQPTWSPDGGWIAFVSNPESNWDIYRIRPDGSQLEQLTVTLDKDAFPHYSMSVDLPFAGGKLVMLGTLVMAAGVGLSKIVWKRR